MKTAGDIELLEKALSYKINKVLLNRLKKIIMESKDEDKIEIAIMYGYSLGKQK